ncbi:MAG: septation protein SepH, partial [Amnibacterium sp.]
MLTLSVIGVEDGAIIAAAPTGERYRVPVDDDLRAKLREAPPAPAERRLSPREIQAHVRAGLSPQQVSALTGAPVAYIERFVGPVLAEREYVSESARAVRLPTETEGARPKTFGAVMAERLAALAATGVRWSSTKETAGWIVALTFTADGIDHDARWRFDPKRMQLTPENVEAATLSQQGTPAALTPRLRAIEPTAPITVVTPGGPADVPEPAPTPAPDMSRFDSAIFAFPDLKKQGQQGTEQPDQR